MARLATLTCFDRAHIFDGEVARSATVVVRGDRIEAVAAGAPCPAGAQVVDVRGKTLLPGLIDAHVHVFRPEHLRTAAELGVTTVLDMFGPPELLRSARQAEIEGRDVGVADMRGAGHLATVPGGHGTEYGLVVPTLTESTDPRAWVDARIWEGSDFLKIVLESGAAWGRPFPTLRASVVPELVAAAHERRRLAVAHVSSREEALVALRSGVDGLAHVFVDAPATRELVDLARAKGAFVTATLALAAGDDALPSPRPSDDPHLKPLLTSDAIAEVRRGPLFPEVARRHLEQAKENVRTLHRAGVDILAGTDATGNAGVTLGASLHHELALLVSAGLSPTESLRAATSVPARRFGLADRGRILPGRRADLVLVEGDPTKDILATRRIVAVYTRGVPVDREAARARAAATQPKVVGGGPLVADFENGLTTRFGAGFSVATDATMGGSSTAKVAVVGAPGKRVLHVTGDVQSPPPGGHPWANVVFSPGEAFGAPVRFPEGAALVFRVRSETATEVSVGVFAQNLGFQPALAPGPKPTREWTEVRIPLGSAQRWDGAHADVGAITGVAWIVSRPGPFAFEIDDVRIE